ncbi:MAG: glycosyltransferase family 2 protein, partial [Coprothermobacter sp.]|nr:glycosyltransferase family 2 protein [Coprothermobacter sp.]
MISVIITSYNRPEMLLKAIESVKKQTYKDFEIIVVDDHSDIEPTIPEGVIYKRLEVNSGGPA